MTDSDDSDSHAPHYNERRKPLPKSHNILADFRDDAAHDSDSDSDGGYSNSDSDSDEGSAEMNDFIDDDDTGPHAPLPFRRDFDDDIDQDDGHRKVKRSRGSSSFSRRHDAEANRRLAERFEQRDDHFQTEVELLEDDEASFSTPLPQWRIALTPNGSRHLFLLNVKPGKEADVVCALMTRYIATQNAGEPFTTIFSAFFTSVDSGAVFVEALTSSEVMKFRNNIKYVHYSKLPRLIPLEEMCESIRVPLAGAKVAPGQFVRVKREISPRTECYKGDLAQVIHLDLNSNRVLLKLLPRIDYAELRKLHDADEDNNALQSRLTSSKQPGSYRPPQTDFNEASVKAFGGEVLRGKLPRKIPGITPPTTVWIYDDTAFVGGFAYKEYPLRNLEMEELNLNSEEADRFVQGLRVTNFELAIPDFERNMCTSLGRTLFSSFEIGDVVRVRRGSEFSGLRVRVNSIEGDVVRVNPVDRQWADQGLEFQKDELERFFVDGDRVKITSGEYTGNTGGIVSVDEKDGQVVVSLDGFYVTVTIDIGHIQLTKEVNPAQHTIGMYSLFDAVRLTDNSEGVIYRIENNTLFVLLTNKETATVQLARVAHKARAQHVKDKSGRTPIVVGQTVKLSQGKREIRARVLHTTAHCVFLFNRELLENLGVMVVDPKDVQVPATETRVGTTTNTRSFITDPRKHDFVGRVVKIVSGPFKGELADVKEADDSMLRVVLQSSGRRANLNRSDGDGRTWMFVTEELKPWVAGAAARLRPEGQDAFSEIFGSNSKKRDSGALDVPSAAAHTDLISPIPHPNYGGGLVEQYPNWGQPRPEQRAWPPQSGVRSPTTAGGTSPYSSSGQAAFGGTGGPNFGMPFHEQSTSPYDHSKYH